MNDSQEPKSFDEWHQKYVDGVYGSDQEIGVVPETFEEYADMYNLGEIQHENDSKKKKKEKDKVEECIGMHGCSSFDIDIDDSLKSSSSSSEDESDGSDGPFEEPSRYFLW